MKKASFTLAEVLITLTIIGVIAALTLPNLYAKYEKQQFVTGLKKFYSVTNQAMKIYMQEKGCDDMVCTGLFDETITEATPKDTQDRLIKEFSTIFKSVKGYRNAENPYQIYNLDGSKAHYGEAPGYFGISLQLADGSLVGIRATRTKCSNYYSGATVNVVCADYVTYDVNGKKGPNKLGRDVFWFSLLLNGELYAVGGDRICRIPNYSHSVQYCMTQTPYHYRESCGDINEQPPANATGKSCAARILAENWQMNY